MDFVRHDKSPYLNEGWGSFPVAQGVLGILGGATSFIAYAT